MSIKKIWRKKLKSNAIPKKEKGEHAKSAAIFWYIIEKYSTYITITMEPLTKSLEKYEVAKFLLPALSFIFPDP